MLNKQKTSIFLIKKIKWEISPKQNKRSLGKKKVKKSFKTTATTATTATTKMAQKKLELKYKYEDLFQLDIPNLMLNIWCYSDEHEVGCNICTTYKSYCVKALKKSGTSNNLQTLMKLFKN